MEYHANVSSLSFDGENGYDEQGTTNREIVAKHLKDLEFLGDIQSQRLKKKAEGKNDVIEHPAHYTQGIECMDYIESHRLNYARGNIIKYVTRAGLKDASKEVEDLEKARWYLGREIERVKKAKKDG